MSSLAGVWAHLIADASVHANAKAERVTCADRAGRSGPLARVGNVLAASPGRDQPGTRIEDHAALVAVVRREHLAQAVDGTSRLAVAQAREGHARVMKPADERERGVEVVSIEDRLVDVPDPHPAEASGL